MTTLESIVKVPCQDKRSGAKGVYLARISDIASVNSAIAATLSAQKDAVILAKATTEKPFTMATGKKFIYVPFEKDSGNVDTTVQGASGSKSLHHVLSGRIAGHDEQKASLLQAMLNDEFICIVPLRNSKFQVLGTKTDGAAVADDAKEMTGGSVSDENGLTLAMEWDGWFQFMWDGFNPTSTETDNGLELWESA